MQGWKKVQGTLLSWPHKVSFVHQNLGDGKMGIRTTSIAWRLSKQLTTTRRANDPSSVRLRPQVTLIRRHGAGVYANQ